MYRTVLRNRVGAIVAVETLDSTGRTLRTITPRSARPQTQALRTHQAPRQPRRDACGAYMAMTPDANGATQPCASCGWQPGDSLAIRQPLDVVPARPWYQPAPVAPPARDLPEQPVHWTPKVGPTPNVAAQLMEIAHAYFERRQRAMQAPPLAPKTLDLVVEAKKAAWEQGRAR